MEYVKILVNLALFGALFPLFTIYFILYYRLLLMNIMGGVVKSDEILNLPC